ncbi:MFS transporter [Actinomadura keratinilytica]|uniref:MFS transporter n=1 Tax=Actinomadura keratinilytica TaxID=547461 RepID=UPI00360A039C
MPSTDPAPVSPAAAAAPSPPTAQRRILTVLVFAQILSGAGLAAGITVGALLAQDMLASTDLAGLPSALFTAGSALTAIAVGRISQARGRRRGLAAGYLTGALGSAGVIAAAVADNPVLLFAALFVYGAGSATNLQARYAGADLAGPAHRARAVSTVLVATTLGVSSAPTWPLLPAPWPTAWASRLWPGRSCSRGPPTRWPPWSCPCGCAPTLCCWPATSTSRPPPRTSPEPPTTRPKATGVLRDSGWAR